MVDLEKYCKTSFIKYNRLLYIGNAIIFICAIIITCLSILNMNNMFLGYSYSYYTFLSPPMSLLVAVPLMFFSLYNIYYTKKIRIDICPKKTGYVPGFFS